MKRLTPHIRLPAVLFAGLVILVSCASPRDQPTQDTDEPLPQATRNDHLTVYSEASVGDRDLTHRDSRLLSMRHTDTRFTFDGFDNREAWENRASRLRDHVQISAGLWPMPEKTSLNSRIFDRTAHASEGYTVEKVYFETHPDFFLAGNLYRPTGSTGPYPAILSPHGHWPRGRINDTERGSVPARAINLARQGYVVFAYDMIGYGDTRQVNHSFASDSLSQLYSINLLGLQLWNSIRALDFLSALPDVDADRIGITGASGGATQTFMLTAVDRENRLKVTAPVNMISTVMQGGSLCENAPGLRLNAFNMHIAGLAAPRPMLMVSNTQDWTLHTPEREYPMMQSIYGLYGAEEKVQNAHFDYPHNYNRASRNAVYPWFARWLKQVDDAAGYREREYDVDADEDLLVFLNEAITDRSLTFDSLAADRYGSLPPGFEEMNEPALKNYLRGRARERYERLWPTDEDQLARFEEVYGTGFRHVMAGEKPSDVRIDARGAAAGSGYTVRKQLISAAGKGHWIPAIEYVAASAGAVATLVVHPNGKASLVDDGAARPGPLVNQLVDAGHRVLAIDPFKIGEHTLFDGTVTERDESINHFLTFNRSDVQEQVQDILTAVRFLESDAEVDRINVIGVGEAGVWSMLAGALAPEAIHHTVALDLPEDVGTAEGARRYFVPGLLKMGGLRTAAALRAPARLTIHGGGGTFDVEAIRQVYGIRGERTAFQTVSDHPVLSDGLSAIFSGQTE